MKKFTVALLYNLKQNAPHNDAEAKPWDAWNELDSEKTVAGIERALRAGGHEVIGMEGDANLPRKLQHYKVDIAFNTCEGHRGGSREAQVPSLLDMLGIPYTGSGVMTLAVALDKPMTKRVLSFHGLPTPKFQTFVAGDEPLDPRLEFPLFVKPSREGSGIGITAKSVCHNARELREQVRTILRDYREAALVEEYIEGREITTGLLGNLAGNIKPREHSMNEPEAELVTAGAQPASPKPLRSNGEGNGSRNRGALRPPARDRRIGDLRGQKMKSTPPRTSLRVFPPLEVDLSPCPPDQAGLYTSVIKSQLYEVPKYLCPAPTTKALRAKLERLAMGAFAALECYDFARVDFRVRRDTGEPYILEVNPLAGLSEGISDIVMEAQAAGVDYTALINGILEAALQRYGMI